MKTKIVLVPLIAIFALIAGSSTSAHGPEDHILQNLCTNEDHQYWWNSGRSLPCDPDNPPNIANGITHDEGSGYPSGLCYPSFNNYTDSYEVETGWGMDPYGTTNALFEDERYFFKAGEAVWNPDQSYPDGGYYTTPVENFTDSLTIEEGDIIQFFVYIHNNGDPCFNDNVNVPQGQFYSDWNTTSHGTRINVEPEDEDVADDYSNFVISGDNVSLNLPAQITLNSNIWSSDAINAQGVKGGTATDRGGVTLSPSGGEQLYLEYIDETALYVDYRNEPGYEWWYYEHDINNPIPLFTSEGLPLSTLVGTDGNIKGSNGDYYGCEPYIGLIRFRMEAKKPPQSGCLKLEIGLSSFDWSIPSEDGEALSAKKLYIEELSFSDEIPDSAQIRWTTDDSNGQFYKVNTPYIYYPGEVTAETDENVYYIGNADTTITASVVGIPAEQNSPKCVDSIQLSLAPKACDNLEVVGQQITIGGESELQMEVTNIAFENQIPPGTRVQFTSTDPTGEFKYQDNVPAVEGTLTLPEGEHYSTVYYFEGEEGNARISVRLVGIDEELANPEVCYAEFDYISPPSVCQYMTAEMEELDFTPPGGEDFENHYRLFVDEVVFSDDVIPENTLVRWEADNETGIFYNALHRDYTDEDTDFPIGVTYTPLNTNATLPVLSEVYYHGDQSTDISISLVSPPESGIDMSECVFTVNIRPPDIEPNACLSLEASEFTIEDTMEINGETAYGLQITDITFSGDGEIPEGIHGRFNALDEPDTGRFYNENGDLIGIGQVAVEDPFKKIYYVGTGRVRAMLAGMPDNIINPTGCVDFSEITIPGEPVCADLRIDHPEEIIEETLSSFTAEAYDSEGNLYGDTITYWVDSGHGIFFSEENKPDDVPENESPMIYEITANLSIIPVSPEGRIMPESVNLPTAIDMSFAIPTRNLWNYNRLPSNQLLIPNPELREERMRTRPEIQFTPQNFPLVPVTGNETSFNNLGNYGQANIIRPIAQIGPFITPTINQVDPEVLYSTTFEMITVQQGETVYFKALEPGENVIHVRATGAEEEECYREFSIVEAPEEAVCVNLIVSILEYGTTNEVTELEPNQVYSISAQAVYEPPFEEGTITYEMDPDYGAFIRVPESQVIAEVYLSALDVLSEGNLSAERLNTFVNTIIEQTGLFFRDVVASTVTRDDLENVYLITYSDTVESDETALKVFATGYEDTEICSAIFPIVAAPPEEGECLGLDIIFPESPWEIDDDDEQLFQINVDTEPEEYQDELIYHWEVTDGDGEWRVDDELIGQEYEEIGRIFLWLVNFSGNTEIEIWAEDPDTGEIIEACFDSISAVEEEEEEEPDIEKFVYLTDEVEDEDDLVDEADDLLNIGDREIPEYRNITYMSIYSAGSEETVEITEREFENESIEGNLGGEFVYRGMRINIEQDNERYTILVTDGYENDGEDEENYDDEYDDLDEYEDAYNCEDGTEAEDGKVCIEGEFDDAVYDFTHGEPITFENLELDTKIYIKVQVENESLIDDDYCDTLDIETGCGEEFLNEIHFEANGYEGEDDTKVIVICPYIITRQGGDVFFYDSIDVGVDIGKCSPVKGPPLIITPPPENGEDIPKTGEGELPEDVFQLDLPSHDICRYSNIKGNIEGYNDIFENFSSSICEFRAEVAEDWKETNINSAIEANVERIARWGENLGGKNTLNNMTNLFDVENKESGVYVKMDEKLNLGEDGEYIIEAVPGQNIPAGQTYIVQRGNLYIKNNIEYGETDYKDPNKIPSAAFIVLDGNIIISPNVRQLNGIFMAVDLDESGDGRVMSENDKISIKPLTINGSLIGDVYNLFFNRRGVGDPMKDQGSVTIRYDERILLNTPPGLEELINITRSIVPR
ncbi:hypothetical protein GF366_03525 [Candidatus Peregrinibacteria bacterium]|nr:hypothetical protein [Candidatus Peregrinibacteria bacterium]